MSGSQFGLSPGFRHDDDPKFDHIYGLFRAQPDLERANRALRSIYNEEFAISSLEEFRARISPSEALLVAHTINDPSAGSVELGRRAQSDFRKISGMTPHQGDDVHREPISGLIGKC